MMSVSTAPSTKILLPGFIILFFLFIWMGCAPSKNPLRKEIKLLQKGIRTDDTSYVYGLPFEPGKKYCVLQGYFGPFSHKERAALDFKMKKGTKICAARDGVVIRVVQENTRGGWSRKNRPYANLIIIQHADGSRSGYWHLQHNGSFVNVGDTVKKGQVIGLSGKTGYSATPHLHFMVWSSGGGRWQQVPTRFETSKGILYLRGWKKYKRPAE